MTITFPCPQCGKLVQVADDAAAAPCTCPQCQSVIDVSKALFPDLPPEQARPTVLGGSASKRTVASKTTTLSGKGPAKTTTLGKDGRPTAASKPPRPPQGRLWKAMVLILLADVVLAVAGAGAAVLWLPKQTPTRAEGEQEPAKPAEPEPAKPDESADVASLLQQLADADPATRAKACQALGEKGTAIPELVKALKDDNENVVRSAVGALENVGPAAQAELIRAFQDKNHPARARIVAVLGKVGDGRICGPILIAALQDKDAKVRESAAQALGVQPETKDRILAELLAALKDENPAVRQAATDGLKQWEPLHESDVPVLAAALKGNPNEEAVEVRRQAADALERLGADAKKAVPELVEALKDKDAAVRRSAVKALGKIGPEVKEKALVGLIDVLADADKEVSRHAKRNLNRFDLGPAELSLLVTALKSKSAEVRHFAVGALEKIGPPAKEAVPALLAVLKRERDDAELRRNIYQALAKIDPETQGGLDVLLAALKEEDVVLRKEAVAGLGKIGATSESAREDALNAILDALKDEDTEVRLSAVTALGEVGSAAKDARIALITTPRLKEALKDKEASVRLAAVTALGNQGQASKRAVPQLAELLKEDDAELRQAVIEALGKLGPTAKEAVPDLAKMLKFKDLRTEALAALGKLGPDAKAAVPQMILFLKDEKFQDQTVEVLAQIGKEAVPELIEALRSRETDLRVGACRALEKIGPDAKDAITLLSRLAKSDFSSDVRTAASEALKKIQAKK